MKHIYLIIALLALTSVPAFALSTQQIPTGQSGGAQFADPDEQMPALVSPPRSGDGGSLSLGDSADASVLPSMGNSDPGARVFDQAFAHQQSGR